MLWQGRPGRCVRFAGAGVRLGVQCTVSISRCSAFAQCSYQVSEKAMAPHSSTLAWKIPWAGELGRLQSMGLLRVRHD